MSILPPRFSLRDRPDGRVDLIDKTAGVTDVLDDLRAAQTFAWALHSHRMLDAHAQKADKANMFN